MAYYNDKQETQKIKEFIKPPKQNKLVNSKEKIKENRDRTLPIRGQG